MVDNEELARRIDGYLTRARRDNLPVYKPMERDIYRVMSGSIGDYGERIELGVFKGNYINVLAEAVQMSRFCGEWCSWNMTDNCNHRYVEKVEVKKPRVPNKAPKDLMLRLKLRGVKW